MIKGLVCHDDVMSPITEGTDDGPILPIDHDFRSHLSLGKGGPDSLPLPIRCEAVLTEAVSQQTAEGCLAAAMSDWRGLRCSRVRRPYDVQSRSEPDVPGDMLMVTPDHHTTYPEARLLPPRLRRYRKPRPWEELTLQRPAPTHGRPVEGRRRHPPPIGRAPG